MITRTLTLFALLLSLPVATGCGGYRVESTTIPHPAYVSSAVPQNRVVHFAERLEQYNGLPGGSLAREASLIRMDPTGVCFNVTLRSLGESAELASLHSYSMELLDAEREPLLEMPQVQAGQPQIQSHQGTVTETYQAGSSTECVDRDERTGGCNRWEDRPIINSRGVPGIVNVATGTGVVCFANNGTVSPQTMEFSLVLRPNRGRGLGFRWEFIVPAGQPGFAAP